MISLIDFYDYGGITFDLLHNIYRDAIHHDFDDYEYTEFGFQVCDTREFELLAEFYGCLDANL